MHGVSSPRPVLRLPSLHPTSPAPSMGHLMPGHDVTVRDMHANPAILKEAFRALLPLVCVVVLGYFYTPMQSLWAKRRPGRAQELHNNTTYRNQTVAVLYNLVYYIGIPSTIFSYLWTAQFTRDDVIFFSVYFGAVLVLYVLSIVGTWMFEEIDEGNIEDSTNGMPAMTFMMAVNSLNTTFPSSLFFGIPVLLQLWESGIDIIGDAARYCIVVFVGSCVLQRTISRALLQRALAARHPHAYPRGWVWAAIRSAVLTPVVISALLGAVFAAAWGSEITILNEILVLIRSATSLTGLFSLGYFLYGKPIVSSSYKTLTMCVVRWFVSPVLFIGATHLAGLPWKYSQMAFLLSSLPPEYLYIRSSIVGTLWPVEGATATQQDRLARGWAITTFTYFPVVFVGVLLMNLAEGDFFDARLAPSVPSRELTRGVVLLWGSLSLLACAWMIVLPWLLPFRPRDGGSSVPMVRHLALSQFGLVLSYMLNQFVDAGDLVDFGSTACTVQAVLISFFGWAVHTWLFVIALYFYWKRKGHHRLTSHTTAVACHVFGWGWPLVATLGPGIYDAVATQEQVYGEAFTWCWLKPRELQFGLFYVPVALLSLVGIGLVLWVLRSSRAEAAYLTRENAVDQEYRKFRFQATLFVVCWVFFWAPGLVNRAIQWSSRENHPQAVVFTIALWFDMSQGVITWLAFGSFRTEVHQHGSRMAQRLATWIWGDDDARRGARGTEALLDGSDERALEDPLLPSVGSYPHYEASGPVGRTSSGLLLSEHSLHTLSKPGEYSNGSTAASLHGRKAFDAGAFDDDDASFVETDDEGDPRGSVGVSINRSDAGAGGRVRGSSVGPEFKTGDYFVGSLTSEDGSSVGSVPRGYGADDAF